MHLLFRIPEMLPKAAKLTPWHPNLEFRGQGGLVVLPPSIHPSGNRYQWCEGLSIWETGISELPSLIADEFRNRYLRSWTTNSPSELVIPVKELRASPELTSRERLHIHQLPYIGRNTKLFLLGCFVNGPAWNQRLFNAACDLQACGWSEELAVRLLLRGAQPWSNQETDAALTTIRSAFASERVRARVFRRPSPIQSR